MTEMSTKDHLHAALVEAMKSGDKLQKSTLRMALSAIQNAEIEMRSHLDEPDILAILQKEVKSRRETAADADRAGRPDISAEAVAEIAILESFLPQGLSEQELRAIIEDAISKTGASSPREMGNIMKLVMPQVRGRADGKEVSALVQSYLQG